MAHAFGAAMIPERRIEAIARVCHEANRIYSLTLGDRSHYIWDQSPKTVRDGVLHGVMFHLANPDAGDAAGHEAWMKERLAAGWKYGPKKSVEAKTHPCLVPFQNLPPEQQVKDRLFRAIVHALAPKEG